MSCLADSPESVTSVCSPTDAAASCFLSAERSYSRVRSPFSRRLPRQQFCGSALAAKAQCAWSSDSPQTSFAGNKGLRQGALTARRIKPVMARPASFRRRDTTGLSTPQNHSLRRPSYPVRTGDVARHKNRKGLPALGKSSFRRARVKESAFKPHS